MSPVSRPASRHPAGELGGADELGEVVGAPGQHAQHILGADDGKQIGLWIAVDGREEHLTARLDQRRAGARSRRQGPAHVRASPCRSRHRTVAGISAASCLDRYASIVDLLSALEQMQSRHLQRRFAHVDAGHLGTACAPWTRPGCRRRNRRRAPVLPSRPARESI